MISTEAAERSSTTRLVDVWRSMEGWELIGGWVCSLSHVVSLPSLGALWGQTLAPQPARHTTHWEVLFIARTLLSHFISFFIGSGCCCPFRGNAYCMIWVVVHAEWGVSCVWDVWTRWTVVLSKWCKLTQIVFQPVGFQNCSPDSVCDDNSFQHVCKGSWLLWAGEEYRS